MVLPDLFDAYYERDENGHTPGQREVIRECREEHAKGEHAEEPCADCPDCPVEAVR